MMERDCKIDKIIKIKIDCREFKVDMELKGQLVAMEYAPTADELIRRKILRQSSSRSFKILIREFN